MEATAPIDPKKLFCPGCRIQLGVRRDTGIDYGGTVLVTNRAWLRCKKCGTRSRHVPLTSKRQ